MPIVKLTSLAAVLLVVCYSTSAQTAAQSSTARWAIAVHGGAGSSEWEHMDAATAAAYHDSLSRALAAGVAKLSAGGKSLDAVEAAINVLEDDPLFNAGRGAGFTAEGTNEMDAAIMEGGSTKAGSVAGVSRTKNPISLARAVMERSPYVMLAGPGTDAFGASIGMPQMPPSYFFTEMRWQELLHVLKESGRPAPERPLGIPDPVSMPAATPGRRSAVEVNPFAHKYGTVGAVARDIHGDLSAGTSTGGMQGKLPGRVGDSPIIGAGTYASNASCAVSATGVGEYFIQLSAAKEICVLVQYRGMSTAAAASFVINREVGALKGGEGGVIVLDRKSDPIWSFNTLGMFRARQMQGGTAVIEVGK